MKDLCTFSKLFYLSTTPCVKFFIFSALHPLRQNATRNEYHAQSIAEYPWTGLIAMSIIAIFMT